MSLRSLRSHQSINLGNIAEQFRKNNKTSTGKRKYENDLIEDKNDSGSIKRKKLFENKNNDYLSEEIKFDIDINFNNNEYITIENDFDINL
ncbi:unnamed protein product [Rhizophagus irregularis]|uniref:Uncharacterized protein n=1 Tax=Rhizophagus irregularis TaxID=588596 RepID=A0A916E3N2_9GLOM|nr:unnamed protein product [Rhizophagus irregularis]